MANFVRFVLAAAVLPGLAAFAPPKPPPALRLYVFDCGQMDVHNDSEFHPGVAGQSRTLADPCFLVVHPKGTLIWDTGLPEGIPDGTVVDNNYTLHIRHLSQQLKDIGYSPDSITYLGISHMHFDHVGDASLFPHATLLIQKAEYDAAFGPTPSKLGYDSSAYQTLRMNPVKKLDGDFDVFGDGSVVIHRAIGHTPGHQTLYVQLPKTGNVLLSGDLAHFRDNWEHQRVPDGNFDSAQTVGAMQEVARFLAAHHAVLWIQHDIDQFRALKHSPAYYE